MSGILKLKENLLGKIFFLCLGLMIIPFMLVTFPMIFENRAELKKAVDLEQTLLSNKQRDEIKTLFSFVKNGIETTSSDESTKLVFDGEMFISTVNAILQTAHKATPDTTGIGIVGTDGALLAISPDNAKVEVTPSLGELKPLLLTDGHTEVRFINFKDWIISYRSIKEKPIRGFVVSWFKKTQLEKILAIKNRDDIKVIPFWSQRTEEITDSFITNHFKDEMVYNKSLLPVGKLNFPLVLAQPKSIVFKKVNEVTTKTIIISILCLIMAVIALYFSLKFIDKTVTSFIKSLEEEAASLTKTSESLEFISSEMVGANTLLKDAIYQSAQAIDELKASMDNALESARQSTEVSEKSATITTQGREVVERMGKVIEDANISNKEITTTIQNNSNEFSNMASMIKEIEMKTRVINDIVFQTKLLSFNASVEAARAGEQGKGFAVVAEEIGSLATMSGDAAKSISELLSTSIRNVSEIVTKSGGQIENVINIGKIQSDVTSKVAQECLTTFDDIKANVTVVDTHLKEISESTREQHRGIELLREAIYKTEKSIHNSEQLASNTVNTSSMIQENGKRLVTLSSYIKVVMKGN